MNYQCGDVVDTARVQGLQNESLGRKIGGIAVGQAGADCRVVHQIGQAIGAQQESILRLHSELSYVDIQPGG